MTMPHDHTHSADVAARVERRWATLSIAIVGLLVGMAAFIGIHQATMPQGHVETADPKTLHLSGEFVESNLGSEVLADGSVMVRAIGQQYSFTPQCIVVPSETPVTFRATSADVVHGLLIEGTNINTMLVPGYVSELHDQLQGHRRPRHAVPGILRHRPSGHVGQGQGGRQGGLPQACGERAEADLC